MLLAEWNRLPYVAILIRLRLPLPHTVDLSSRWAKGPAACDVLGQASNDDAIWAIFRTVSLLRQEKRGKLIRCIFPRVLI